MTNMARYNIAEAKARFSELVERALAGDEVVIARANKPLLRIVPYEDHRRKLRPWSARERILDMAADFNATPDDLAEYR
jgi:prevent-host-death family protein